MTPTSAIVVGLALLGISGCAAGFTEAVVRDPSQVEVVYPADIPGETERSAVVLPAGSEPREIVLPRKHGRILYEAVAVRSATGAITLRCDGCAKPSMEVLSADGHFLHGIASSEFSNFHLTVSELKDDSFVTHVAYPYEPNPRTRAEHILFTADLVTPKSNLLSVRRTPPDRRGSAWLGVSMFLVFTGAGVATTYYATQTKYPLVPAVLGGTADVFGVWAGVLAVISLVRGDFATPEPEVIWPPSTDR
jgi:hypothetical protein